jgi:hypothetical protein
MRSIAGRVVLVAVTISLILTCYAHRGQTVVAQQHTPLAVTRLYTGADGLSHVEQVSVRFSPVDELRQPLNTRSLFRSPVRTSCAWLPASLKAGTTRTRAAT